MIPELSLSRVWCMRDPLCGRIIDLGGWFTEFSPDRPRILLWSVRPLSDSYYLGRSWDLGYTGGAPACSKSSHFPRGPRNNENPDVSHGSQMAGLSLKPPRARLCGTGTPLPSADGSPPGRSRRKWSPATVPRPGPTAELEWSSAYSVNCIAQLGELHTTFAVRS